MNYRLECRMTAPVAIQKAFALFGDPHNLAEVTPRWLNFRIVTPERVVMRQGAEIDYVIGWLNLPLKWKTIITRYEPPSLFEDEQARGPYALWRHLHVFEECAEGTLISDRVDYRLPLGILGRMAHALTVKNQLMEIFRYRQRAIARLLQVTGTSFDEPRITNQA